MAALLFFPAFCSGVGDHSGTEVEGALRSRWGQTVALEVRRDTGDHVTLISHLFAGIALIQSQGCISKFI